jgi:hypothetical protein
MQQTTDTVLMIRPTDFRSNEETAVNNHFQNVGTEKNTNEIAQQEFDHFVKLLRENEVGVIVIENNGQENTPDALYPNNWISFHKGNQVVIYPMFAENRRRERNLTILQNDSFESRGKLMIQDYTAFEQQGEILEGTGSMILDRINKKAYCSKSPRSSQKVLKEFCHHFEYSPIIFNSYQTVEGQRKPIYHTNVMLSIGEDFAVICASSIDDSMEVKTVIESLQNDGKKIIHISEEQVNQFAGNMLQVRNTKNERLLVMSETARNSLNENQIKELTKKNKLVVAPLNTIEYYGGGSARCMLAEVF